MKRTQHDSLSGDGQAALEGLPLYLILLAVCAAVGVAVVLGWLSTISDSKEFGSVIVDPDEIQIGNDTTISFAVTVSDLRDDPVTGAQVILDGCNVKFARNGTGSPTLTTGENGQAQFVDLFAEVGEKSQCDLKIIVRKEDYPEKIQSISLISE